MPERTRANPKKKQRKVKLTTSNVDRWQQKLYLENLPELVKRGYKQVLLKAEEGNMKAIEICLQLANLYKPTNGQINIVNQVYSKNGGGDSGATVRTQSFESILRRLESSDQAALPAPTDVIDV
jgi:hypothetical protein